jgi:predicted DsbA family dithiol-disulfide isomerase
LVAADFADYARLKLKGTPSFIISKIGRDGRRIETVIAGAEKLEYFERVIDELLKMP